MNTNIRFEDWEAEQMKDPKFRAAVEELEPAYQAAQLLQTMCARGDVTIEYEENYYIVGDDRFLRYAIGSTLAEAKENYGYVLLEYYKDLCDMEECLAPHLAYDLQELRTMRERLWAMGQEGRLRALEYDGDPIEDLHHILPEALPAEEWQNIISGACD